MLIGALAYRIYLARSVNILEAVIITVDLGLVLANEKKAVIEDRISRNARHAITGLMLLGLAALWFFAVF